MEYGKRTKVLLIRVTESQHADAMRRAEEAGMSLSEFVRRFLGEWDGAVKADRVEKLEERVTVLEERERERRVEPLALSEDEVQRGIREA